MNSLISALVTYFKFKVLFTISIYLSMEKLFKTFKILINIGVFDTDLHNIFHESYDLYKFLFIIQEVKLMKN